MLLIGINFKKRKLAEKRPMPPKREVASVGDPCHPALVPDHTVSWLNSSVTLLVSKAPLNRTVKNGCFWVDPPFRFRVQKANFAFLFSGGLKKKADPLINFPLLTKSVTWDTVCPVSVHVHEKKERIKQKTQNLGYWIYLVGGPYFLN